MSEFSTALQFLNSVSNPALKAGTELVRAIEASCADGPQP